MREQLYDQIKEMLGDYDGQNKDGVFVTYDGQQYSIKVVAKKKITTFDGQPEVKTEAAPSIKMSDFIKKVEQTSVSMVDMATIVDLFGEDVADV